MCALHIHTYFLWRAHQAWNASALWNLPFGSSTAVSCGRICGCCHPKANCSTCAHTYINLLAHMHGGLTFGNCTYSCVIFAKVLLYFLHFTTKKWLQIGKYCNFPRILLRYHTIRPIYSTESPPAGLGSGIIHGFHLFSPSNWRIPKIIRSLCQ